MLNPVRVLAEESVVQHQCTCAGVVHTASGWERNEVSMVTVSSTHRVTGERLLVSIHSRWSQWSPLPSFVEADNSVAIISVSYLMLHDALLTGFIVIMMPPPLHSGNTGTIWYC